MINKVIDSIEKKLLQSTDKSERIDQFEIRFPCSTPASLHQSEKDNLRVKAQGKGSSEPAGPDVGGARNDVT